MFSIKNNSQNRWLKSCLFCVFISASFFCAAQPILNLVNNASAEQFTNCPTNAGQVLVLSYWYLPTGPGGSSDYYNVCANSNTLAAPNSTRITVPQNEGGFQFPKTGNAFFGFALYGIVISGIEYREYLGNGLKQTLKNGKTYCVTYYVSLAEISRYACDNIGVVFTPDSLLNTPTYPPQPLVLVPDFESNTIISDTLNWVQIQGQFSANGTERFITIGNFRTDANTNSSQVKPLNLPPNQITAYYYVDDISVVEINNANASIKDTVYKCSLDTVQLGTDSTQFATYSWSPNSALSCSNCPNPIATPSITTKYYLTKQQCSATTVDSVIVSILTPTTPAQAGSDKTICSGESTVLGTDSISNVVYTWQQTGSTLSCTNCPHPTAMPDSSTFYVLSRQECSFISYDTVRVFIDDCNPTFTVPTVFTPNYDGVNDTWGIKFSSINHISNFSVDVYDRWGLLVFSSNPSHTPNPELNTPNLKWDGHTPSGEACSSGTYFYVITFTKNEEVQRLKGFLSLFR